MEQAWESLNDRKEKREPKWLGFKRKTLEEILKNKKGSGHDTSVELLWLFLRGDLSEVRELEHRMNYSKSGLRSAIYMALHTPRVRKEAMLLLRWDFKALPNIYMRLRSIDQFFDETVVSYYPDAESEMDYGTVDFSARYSYDEVKKERPKANP